MDESQRGNYTNFFFFLDAYLHVCNLHLRIPHVRKRFNTCLEKIAVHWDKITSWFEGIHYESRSTLSIINSTK